jgi:hypothetical protein
MNAVYLLVVVQAALATRDLARSLQQREEGVLLTEGKERDKKLHDTR